MKFSVTFKDPDGPYDSIQDAAKAQVDAMTGIDEDEREGLLESRVGKLREFTGQWLKYGEYVTIEFDTEAGTATVVKDES